MKREPVIKEGLQGVKWERKQVIKKWEGKESWEKGKNWEKFESGSKRSLNFPNQEGKMKGEKRWKGPKNSKKQISHSGGFNLDRVF